MSWKRQREEDPLKSLKSKPEATREGQRSSWTCIELTDVFVKEERQIVCPVEDQWQVVSETKHQLERLLQVRRAIAKRS